MRRLRSGTDLQKVLEEFVEDLSITLTVWHDKENDALIFDFGLREGTVDLPEPDGRVVWQIGVESDSVAGFCLLGAERFGVSGVRVDIAARKEQIERGVKGFPAFLASGRVTRVMIDEVSVRAEHERREAEVGGDDISEAFARAINQFEELAAASD